MSYDIESNQGEVGFTAYAGPNGTAMAQISIFAEAYGDYAILKASDLDDICTRWLQYRAARNAAHGAEEGASWAGGSPISSCSVSVDSTSSGEENPATKSNSPTVYEVHEADSKRGCPMAGFKHGGPHHNAGYGVTIKGPACIGEPTSGNPPGWCVAPVPCPIGVCAINTLQNASDEHHSPDYDAKGNVRERG